MGNRGFASIADVARPRGERVGGRGRGGRGGVGGEIFCEISGLYDSAQLVGGLGPVRVVKAMTRM